MTALRTKPTGANVEARRDAVDAGERAAATPGKDVSARGQATAPAAPEVPRVEERERQLLLEQMKEANEKLTLMSIRAQELAEESEEARRRLEVSEHELRGAVEFRERLIATVSHDLRNPLGTISMAIDVLLRGSSLDAQGKKIVEGIRRTVDRMSTLIAQLLEFTRYLSDERLPLRRRPTDLRKVCEEVVEELEIQHSMPGRFRREFHGDLTGDWDADRLAQVVSNLGGNAIEHGAANTPIDVRASDEGDEVRLEIHSRGEPIPPELLPFIFAPFRQANPQDRSKGHGFGLGLYIGEQIVRGHGGSIAARSTTAEGTTFTIRLPRRAPGAVGPLAAHDDSEKLVLLVDDDPEWTALLGMFLQGEGFHVAMAGNGEEALARMAEKRPSLALVDLNMPIMDGRELLRRLVGDPALSTVPVAILTSDPAPPSGYVVFRKPVSDLEALVQFARRAVAGALE